MAFLAPCVLTIFFNCDTSSKICAHFIFTVRQHAKEILDKNGQRVSSNWKSIRTRGEIIEERNARMDEEILARMEIENNPVLKKIKSNWDSMRVNYEIYHHNPLHATFDNELISDLDEIKDMFMNNLADQIKRFENDPLNTDLAVHATNSIPQGGEGWKKERIILMTASDIHDFAANEDDPTAAINICKKKFGLGPSIDHLPAIKWGRKKESVAIADFETAKGGKVTKTGLHISKEYPQFGKIVFKIHSLSPPLILCICM